MLTISGSESKSEANSKSGWSQAGHNLAGRRGRYWLDADRPN
jgi:hypothetical protein